MLSPVENEDSVRLLVNKIFGEENLDAERKSQNSSIPTCVLSEDFIRSVKYIIDVKRYVVFHRWRKYFDACYKTMLRSHQDYLTFLMFACINEHNSYNSVCESFISVCALVELLCDETLRKTGVNFYGLIPDFIMVYYRHIMAESFCRPKLGFKRFVEYIRGHRYLKWGLNKDYSVSPNEPSAAVSCIDKQIEKELKTYRVSEKKFNPKKVAEDEDSQTIADYVLDITSFVFPDLPSSADLLKSVKDYKKKKIAKSKENSRTEPLKGSLDGCSISNSDYKTNSDPKHQNSIEEYEKIIQNVTRQKYMKRSNNGSSNNSIRVEADGILKQLNSTIKSILEILNELDDE